MKTKVKVVRPGGTEIVFIPLNISRMEKSASAGNSVTTGLNQMIKAAHSFQLVVLIKLKTDPQKAGQGASILGLVISLN